MADGKDAWEREIANILRIVENGRGPLLEGANFFFFFASSFPTLSSSGIILDAVPEIGMGEMRRNVEVSNGKKDYCDVRVEVGAWKFLFYEVTFFNLQA